MTDQSKWFDTPMLKFLVESGRVGLLVASGCDGGFLLLMRDGESETVLRAQRGGSRVFSRLDTVARYVREAGLKHFAVELDHWGEA